MALSTISGTTGITDATITSAKLADFSAAVDLNGVELVLDADADTSITADTDDRIDFKIANVEHFSFSNSSGDTIVKPMVDAKDIKFQQFDGRTLLDINDAGFVGIENGATGPGAIRLFEDSDLGSNYVGLSVGNVSTAYTLVFPNADGSSGQALTTNGSGVLSFSTLTANTPSSADGQALGSASLEWSDLFLADASTIQFGADQDVTLTHVADTGLLLNTASVIQFRDSAINIGSPADGDLDINADDEIELNSTLIDINGAVDISGTLTLAGNLIVGSATVTEAQLEILDGATVTTTELNLIDGGATVGTTAIADGDGLLINDAGTMRVSTVQTLAAYLDDEITAMPNLVTVGAAQQLTTLAGIPFYQGDSGSIYTHNVSGTDSSAQFNSAYGLTAMDAITTGDDNTAMGYGALGANTTGATNSAFGKSALLVNTTGGSNTAIGREALLANTEGSTNTAVGLVALAANTTASNNTAVGSSAMAANTTGASNTAVGASALDANTSGSLNTAVGFSALSGNTEGAQNVAVGRNAALATTTAVANTAIGTSALSGAITTGGGTAVGGDALKVTTGTNNTAIGYGAGETLTTGTNNTLIGFNADPSAVDVSNEMTLGDANVTNLRCNDTSVGGLSDQRDKANIQDLPVSAGLALINALRPVTFNWDRREWYDDNTPDGSKIELDYDNAKANSGLKQGFLAQEVATAISGIKALEDEKLISDINPDKLEFSPAKLITNLIKAVQELSAKNDTLETANTALADRITALENA